MLTKTDSGAAGLEEELVALAPLFTNALLRLQDDKQLTWLVTHGDERAFAAIVQRHTPALHRHCTRLLGPTGAEDCVQQTFVAAWSTLSQGGQITDLTAWLHRVARNHALDALRRSSFRCHPYMDGGAPGEDAAVEVLRRALARQTLAALGALPARQRQALVSTAVEGQSGRQVARELGLSECALRQLVRRARAALRSACAALVPAGWQRAASRPAEDPDLSVLTQCVVASTIGAKLGIAVMAATPAAGGAQVASIARQHQGVRAPAQASAFASAGVRLPAPARAPSMTTAVRQREMRSAGAAVLTRHGSLGAPERSAHAPVSTTAGARDHVGGTALPAPAPVMIDRAPRVRWAPTRKLLRTPAPRALHLNAMRARPAPATMRVRVAAVAEAADAVAGVRIHGAAVTTR